MKADCQRCQGAKGYYERFKDRSGKWHDPLGIECWILCEMCLGKGYTDDTDRLRYLRSMGVTPRTSVTEL